MSSEERKVFKNGLVAIAEPMEHKKKAVFYVGIDVGSKNESKEKKGGAHLLEHMMFFSNNYKTSDEIAEILEFNGMSANAHTSHTTTTIEVSLPPDKLSTAVSTAYQAVINTAYDKTEFEIEKNGPVARELINAEHNPLQRFVMRYAFPRIFEGTPLADSVIGTFESVTNLQIPDLMSLKNKFYIPNNMVLVATGAVDKSQFFDSVENTFAKMEQKPVAQPEISWAFRPGISYVEFDDFKSKQPEQDQAYAFLVYKVKPNQHKDTLGLALLQTMIGGGLTSRLFKQLRKERGIGYTPAASYDALRGNAVFYMGVPGLHPNQIEQTFEVMQGITGRLRKELVDEKFFVGKKTQLESDYLSIMESSKMHAAAWITKEFDKPFYDFRTVLDELKRVTRENLREIANENFSGEPLILIASAPGYKTIFNK